MREILFRGQTRRYGEKVRMNGEKVKSNLGLRSSKFTIDPQTGSITTYGWGHGVGMSQLGAKGYARYEGWSYTQILTHYYQGTTVK